MLLGAYIIPYTTVHGEVTPQLTCLRIISCTKHGLVEPLNSDGYISEDIKAT